MEKRRICILQEICFFIMPDIKGKTLTNRRMEVLERLQKRKKREPVTVITTMDTFLDGIISRMKFKKTEFILQEKIRLILRNLNKI